MVMGDPSNAVETNAAGANAGAVNAAETNAVESARQWLRDWGAEVSRADIAAGRQRFDQALVAFGTHADVVSGRDVVEAEQWSKIWPAIEDFEFAADDAEILVADDGSMAVIIAGWTSTGIAADGQRFPRPGRATIVVRRNDDQWGGNQSGGNQSGGNQSGGNRSGWIGLHTHFSLVRGVPSATFGTRVAIR